MRLNRLSRLPVLPVLALSLVLSGPARADAPQPPQVSVMGEGRFEAAPDMATISLGVTTMAATAAEAMARNGDDVARVLANLTAAGIEARDVQTTGLSLNPNWTNYDSAGGARIEGYTAQNLVSVRVRALDRLGGILDAAIKDGANTLNSLTFGIAEPGPAEATARTRAVEDARRKAEALAGAAGLTLGPVLSIAEGGGYAAPMPMFRTEAASDGVPVAGGEIAVVVGVTVVWTLEE